MPQFRILTHDHPFLHWDLMLESGGILRTWRLLTEPATTGSTSAEPLKDHRIEYLTYEGPVSGNRGIVTNWDSGDFEWIEDKPEQGIVSIRLHGTRLNGDWRLTKPDCSEQLHDDRSLWRFEPTHAAPEKSSNKDTSKEH